MNQETGEVKWKLIPREETTKQGENSNEEEGKGGREGRKYDTQESGLWDGLLKVRNVVYCNKWVV